MLSQKKPISLQNIENQFRLLKNYSICGRKYEIGSQYTQLKLPLDDIIHFIQEIKQTFDKVNSNKKIQYVFQFCKVPELKDFEEFYQWYYSQSMNFPKSQNKKEQNIWKNLRSIISQNRPIKEQSIEAIVQLQSYMINEQFQKFNKKYLGKLEITLQHGKVQKLGYLEYYGLSKRIFQPLISEFQNVYQIKQGMTQLLSFLKQKKTAKEIQSNKNLSMLGKCLEFQNLINLKTAMLIQQKQKTNLPNLPIQKMKNMVQRVMNEEFLQVGQLRNTKDSKGVPEEFILQILEPMVSENNKLIQTLKYCKKMTNSSECTTKMTIASRIKQEIKIIQTFLQDKAKQFDPSQQGKFISISKFQTLQTSALLQLQPSTKMQKLSGPKVTNPQILETLQINGGTLSVPKPLLEKPFQINQSEKQENPGSLYPYAYIVRNKQDEQQVMEILSPIYTAYYRSQVIESTKSQLKKFSDMSWVDFSTKFNTKRSQKERSIEEELILLSMEAIQNVLGIEKCLFESYDENIRRVANLEAELERIKNELSTNVRINSKQWSYQDQMITYGNTKRNYHNYQHIDIYSQMNNDQQISQYVQYIKQLQEQVDNFKAQEKKYQKQLNTLGFYTRELEIQAKKEKPKQNSFNANDDQKLQTNMLGLQQENKKLQQQVQNICQTNFQLQTKIKQLQGSLNENKQSYQSLSQDYQQLLTKQNKLQKDYQTKQMEQSAIIGFLQNIKLILKDSFQFNTLPELQHIISDLVTSREENTKLADENHHCLTKMLSKLTNFLQSTPQNQVESKDKTIEISEKQSISNLYEKLEQKLDTVCKLAHTIPNTSPSCTLGNQIQKDKEKQELNGQIKSLKEKIETYTKRVNGLTLQIQEKKSLLQKQNQTPIEEMQKVRKQLMESKAKFEEDLKLMKIDFNEKEEKLVNEICLLQKQISELKQNLTNNQQPNTQTQTPQLTQQNKHTQYCSNPIQHHHMDNLIQQVSDTQPKQPILNQPHQINIIKSIKTLTIANQFYLHFNSSNQKENNTLDKHTDTKQLQIEIKQEGQEVGKSKLKIEELLCKIDEDCEKIKKLEDSLKEQQLFLASKQKSIKESEQKLLKVQSERQPMEVQTEQKECNLNDCLSSTKEQNQVLKAQLQKAEQLLKKRMLVFEKINFENMSLKNKIKLLANEREVNMQQRNVGVGIEERKQKDIENKIKILSQKQQCLTKKLNDLKDSIKKADNEKKQFKDLTQKLKDLQSEIIKRTAQFQKLDEDTKETQKHIQQMRSEAVLLENKKVDIEKYVQQNKGLEEKRDGLVKQIERKESLVREQEKQKIEIEKLIKDRKVIETEVEQLKKIRKELQEQQIKQTKQMEQQKLSFDKEYDKRKNQEQSLVQRIKQNQTKLTNLQTQAYAIKKQQVLKYGIPNSLFIGQIISDQVNRSFLISQIQNLYHKKKVCKTKLLFSFPLMKSLDPHNSVDNVPNYILLIKVNNQSDPSKPYLIGCFSEAELRQGEQKLNTGKGFICSITNQKTVFLRQSTVNNPRLTEYDRFHFIYGNSELRFIINSNKLDMSLYGGIYKSFNTNGVARSEFIGEDDEIVEMLGYEFWSVIFENEEEKVDKK